MAEIEILVTRLNKPSSRAGRQFFEVANYQDGDAVITKARPSVWGRREDKRVWVAQGNTPASFPNESFIVAVTNIPTPRLDNVYSWLEVPEDRPAIMGDPEFDRPPERRFVATHRRIFRFTPGGFNPPEQSDIDNDGFVQITFGRFNALCRRKTDNAQVPNSNKPGWPGRRQDQN